MSHSVDLLNDTLAGRRLIEASAGTGKTYTLALLYVRLVLGHDPRAGQPRRPLTPPEILVVTFTDAATQELRDRIRARLAQAARLWRGQDDAAPPGDPLRALRDSLAPDTWPGDARRLELAAEWMDQAAVFTIHGWCRRMLSEHAFDSGSLFSLELQTDLSQLLAEAVRDYWRTFYVPMPPEAVAHVALLWTHPAALQQALGGLLSAPHSSSERDAKTGDEDTPLSILAQIQEQHAARLAEIKQPWREGDWAQSLRELLTPLKLGFQQAMFDKLQAWVDTPDQEQPTLTETAWHNLTPAGLAEKNKAGKVIPQHPALEAIARLPQQLAQLPKRRPALLRHALAWVRERWQTEQERRAWMGFDGLLTRLDAALQGPGGGRLAQRIRAQFPAALVDEFQDTDPLQYRLFDRIYPADDDGCALMLIGDPKQAIYGFRGADIYTYWQARRAAGSQVGTLTTNFRSSAGMVAAVNGVFGAASQRLGGALFMPGAPADEPAPVPFEPVQAQGLAERLVIRGGSPAALTLWVDDATEPKGRKADQQDLARACAAHVLSLLQDAQTGFLMASGELRRLQPADCALLVNDGNEAAALGAALHERGLRSVYVSDRSSVYASPQAAELLLLLQACAEPESGRRVRAALACAALGLSLAQLDALQHSDSAWSQRLEQFQRYRQLWRGQGILPMLRHLLADFGVPQNLLAAGDERALTNWMHLAELLQQASGLIEGELALVRYLTEQVSGQGAEADELRLRLPGEEGLIQIVTVHKSKGLEYPLVWLPFASAARSVGSVNDKNNAVVGWHDAQGVQHRVLLPEADEAERAQADRERLGEDVRKLYVALTRARHATWMTLTPHAQLSHSALAWVTGLAGSGSSRDAPGAPLREQAQAWAQALPGDSPVAVQPVPQAPAQSGGPRWQPDTPPREPRVPPPLAARTGPPWRFVSYSSLPLRDEAAQGAPSVLAEDAVWASAAHERLRDPALVAETLQRRAPDGGGPWDDPAVPPVPDGPEGMHALPAGTQAGTLMHGLLEWALGEGRVARHQDGVQADQVARRCAVRGWSRWIPALEQALQQWLATPLPWPWRPGSAPPLALGDLASVQVEMEFWLPAQRVDLVLLDDLVRQYTLTDLSPADAPRPALQPGEVHGLFRGFMDLVAEVDGRYVVLDYKSSRLGRCAADYSAEVLGRAMAQHRYDLQGVIYLYALHRLLRARLPDYDYERHVGGVGCLFLRGIDGPVGGLHLERPPHALMVALDALMGADTSGEQT